VLASPPVVSVVVVNWNAGASLGHCLASLAADVASGVEVVLLDNASTDDSTAEAVRDRSWVRTVTSAENLGFARGANAGAAAARGDVLVFLNPDAVVEPGAVAAIVAALGANPDAGIAGGGLVDEDGRWQPGAARFAVLPHLLLDTTLGRLATRRRRAAHVVDWVYGTFMAVRRDVFATLGGFDGGYFLYGEDLDLCHRARERGWQTLHVPIARARHARNVSATGRFGLARDAAVVEGELRFYARRRGAAAAGCYRAVAAAKFGLKAVLATLVGRRTSARRAALVVRVCLGARAEMAA
jgi:N-acetylglucosaminyl-diphospho-decaprenol L-rhamnosyltransferase